MVVSTFYFSAFFNNMNGCGLESRKIGVRFAAVDSFSPVHSDQTGYGAKQPPNHMVIEALSLGVNRQ
jgi:hypothetical protein